MYSTIRICVFWFKTYLLFVLNEQRRDIPQDEIWCRIIRNSLVEVVNLGGYNEQLS